VVAGSVTLSLLGLNIAAAHFAFERYHKMAIPFHREFYGDFSS
jgi:hypothetical protein